MKASSTKLEKSRSNPLLLERVTVQVARRNRQTTTDDQTSTTPAGDVEEFTE